MAPFSSLLGYLFLCIFGYPKNHVFWLPGYQNGTILEILFWHLFRIGPKSIFEDPYIENATLSLPRAAQNEVKNDAEMEYPKRYPRSEKVPQNDPLGPPAGHQKGDPKTIEKNDPQKTLKKNCLSKEREAR